MRIKPKNLNAQTIKNELYFSPDQDEQRLGPNLKAGSQVKAAPTKEPKRQSIKNEPIKRETHSLPQHPPPRPIKISNNMQIKLEPSDIRFIQKIIEQKHGKILTHQEMTSLKKKMVRQNFNESNPYNELNYNTGERNEWKDNKKKHLSEEDIKKLKRHFLNVMKIVNKGEQSKYTLRDMVSEFNLDESAYLQIKRQFELDPQIAHHLKRYANKCDQQNESSQIYQIVKKRYIMEKILTKNPLLTKTQISQKILRHTKNQNFFPESQIVRLLQSEGYNWRTVVKYPESRNHKQNLQRKKKFCQKINSILTETRYNVYFLGVMNFNSFMFRTEGWTRDEYLIAPNIDESFSLVALAERSGEGTWKFQKQIHKEEVFSETCRTLFDHIFADSYEPKYVAVDFKLFKYFEAIKKSRRRNDIEIIWIPPFSYNLNPLEFWFEEIKEYLGQSKNIIQLQQPLKLPEKRNEFLIKDIYNDLKEIFVDRYNTLFDFGTFFEMAAQNHRKALQMKPV